jgi:SAM-dependent methyltransferase
MGHTHDGIDWTDRLNALRQADEIDADVTGEVAERLVELVVTTGSSPGVSAAQLPAGSVGERREYNPVRATFRRLASGNLDPPIPPPNSRSQPLVARAGGPRRPVAVDVGSGGGGMSAALALALGKRGGGTVVLADAVPELLTAAGEHVLATVEAAGLGDTVTVETRLGDAADPAFLGALPAADLLWAARVVHHLPDQQRAIDDLAARLAPGGWLALGEGGLSTRCLPWDLGIGDPGLGDRLIAARDVWFVRMRGEMPGVVSMPYGWNRALAVAGLTEVSAFSYLNDHPAPASPAVRASIVNWLEWMGGRPEVELSETDRTTVRRLLDPEDPAYVAAREDVFHLSTATVHLGRRPAA